MGEEKGTMKPQNLEEKVVWYYLLGTYVWYLLGAHFALAPTLAWLLAFYLIYKKLWLQTDTTPAEEKVAVPSVVWAWIVSMLVVAIAIFVSHTDFDLGTSTLFSSTLGWAKGWALLALFPLIGCLGNIRPKLVYRAVCIVCLQSLIFIPICYVGALLHLQPSPDIPLYVSPLKYVAGGGANMYAVNLYMAELEGPSRGALRFVLFAPWAPALGLVSNVYFFLALQESDRKWRWIGILGAVAMAVVSVSRLGFICLPAVLLLSWYLTNFTRPSTQIASGIVCFLTGIFAPFLINWVQEVKAAFTGARAGSSRVRRILNEIGLARWRNDAPIWGHGLPEFPGPKIVEGMPIGSHHTWVALLYTLGLVGCIALAIPMCWSFIVLFIKAQKSKMGRAALSVFLVIAIFTTAETLDSLAFLYWPGLLIMGIAFRRTAYVQQPVLSVG